MIEAFDSANFDRSKPVHETTFISLVDLLPATPPAAPASSHKLRGVN